MQFVVRSLGRVGSDLPRLCRWRQWPAALVRREAPLMLLSPAHPDLDRLSGSVYKPWRLIPFACGSTKCMDVVASRPHDGAMCSNDKFLQEDFSASDVDDCYENGVNVASIPVGTSHRDGAIYNSGFLLEEFIDSDINDRNETRLEPMMLSNGPVVYGPAQFMFHFFSVMLSRSPISNGSIQLYGYIAARDERDTMLNYIVNYTRDNPIAVQQGSLIEMTGPKRGILMCSAVIIEFDMRIKMAEHEDDDPQLIDGALVCRDQVYVPSIPIKQRIIGSSGAVDVTLAVIGCAVEATIEVVISEVQSGLSLSLSSFVDVCGVPGETQLFNGLISQPEVLRRFVVAVKLSSMLLLKFVFGDDVDLHTTTNTRRIMFPSKVRGCASKQIRLKAATISVKVNWSRI